MRIGVLYGKQLGAYFGNSLTCVDLNGNQLDDLVIGAPLHSKYENNVEGKYETGRVYVFHQRRKTSSSTSRDLRITGSNWFKESQTMDGELSKGRFGLSVAALGVINLDGFNARPSVRLTTVLPMVAAVAPFTFSTAHPKDLAPRRFK